MAGAELCRELVAMLARPAAVSPGGRLARAGDDEAAETPADALGRTHELAGRLRGLAATLAQQADAVQTAAGESFGNAQPGTAMSLQISASEAERARLARDLHDGPAQYFANAVFETEYLRKLLTRDPEAVGEGLARLRESLQQGVKEIRQCLFDLRLPAVEELGLVALLHGYLPEYERQYGVSIEASLPEDELPLSGDQAVAVFRILQEALNNARKHADASQVRVKLRRRGDEVLLQVEDNGHGFTPGQARPGHYGLMGMQERAHLLGGRLEVQGRPGKGARILLTLPLR
ncbi:MAG TPA: sensor histidine kinase [Chloroflexota bacterium]|nr:sensor histidine kinase [Chloroflexota bacterium]